MDGNAVLSAETVAAIAFPPRDLRVAPPRLRRRVAPPFLYLRDLGIIYYTKKNLICEAFVLNVYYYAIKE